MMYTLRTYSLILLRFYLEVVVVGEGRNEVGGAVGVGVKVGVGAGVGAGVWARSDIGCGGLLLPLMLVEKCGWCWRVKR